MNLTRLLEKIEYKPFQLKRIEEEIELFGYNLLHQDTESAKNRLEDIKKYSQDLAGKVTANALDGIMLSVLGLSIFFAPEIKDYLKTDMEIPRYLSTAFRIAGGVGVAYGLLKVFGNIYYYRDWHNHLNEAQSRLNKTLISPTPARRIQ